MRKCEYKLVARPQIANATVYIPQKETRLFESVVYNSTVREASIMHQWQNLSDNTGVITSDIRSL